MARQEAKHEQREDLSNASERTRRFIEALRGTEASHDAAIVADVFTPASELRSLAHPDALTGKRAPFRFWQAYLDVFDTVESTFTNIFEQGPMAVLEWSSQGVLRNGAPVTYRGVSILHFAEDGSVERFNTFYDTSAFMRNDAQSAIPTSAPHAQQAVS